jgi:hypothetical protein
MSTRSSIGVKLPNEQIKAIYCHFDGYPSGVGKILKDHYTTEEKINALMELGDLSVLGPEIGEKQDFDNQNTHNENWCLAYGRDRGQAETEASIYSDIKEWVGETWVDYHYLWNGSSWEITKA